MSTPKKSAVSIQRIFDRIGLGPLDDVDREAAIKLMISAFLIVFGGVAAVLSGEPSTGTPIARFGFAGLMGVVWVLLMVAVKRAPKIPANLVFAAVATLLWQFKSGVL